MDIVNSVATKVGNLLVDPIGQCLVYLIKYGTNIDDFKEQVEKLKLDRDALQLLVDAATRNGENILPDVDEWLKNVNRHTQESEEFLNGIMVDKWCFGLCTNLKSRYQRSKKAKKKTLIIDGLRRDRKFNRVSLPAPPPKIASISMKDLEIFESRKSTFNEIMEALRDDQINVIGIYGMGGIGKTTIVKEVAKQAEKDNLFDEIVMSVVSQTPNVRNIQGEIAEMLGLILTEESKIVRAGRLCERLKHVEKILVILDDLWTRLDLEDIGIPHGNVHKGCKIVLTSRSQDVCREMNTQVHFLIGVLSELEAWNLFRETAGDAVDLPDLHPVATKVAKECAGLPIAIVTVAMALKGKSMHAWSDALHQLRASSTNNIKGMRANVYSSLELSYNYLESEEVKVIFLLCCLFPEDIDIPIEYLVRYGMGLRLFENVCKLEAARDRVHFFIENLKACCLLLDGKVEGSVRMHDVVRDFALSVASQGQYKLLVRIGAGLKEWLKMDIFADHTAIGLLYHQFYEQTSEFDCSNLNGLILGCDSNLLKIPDTFFEGMKKLRVLHMHYTSLPSLPPSIQCLKNLRTMSLVRCKLRDISLIGELKNLEILSFHGSDFEELAREIGKLTRLKLLDLSNCKQLKVIPPDVLSNLLHLEDLYIINSFEHWGMADQGQGTRSTASLAELKSLSHLSVLEMHIPNIKLCPKDLVFGNLTKFKISVGSSFGVYAKYPYPKTLKFKLDQSLTFYDGLKMLLKIAEYLIVEEMEDLEDVLRDSKGEGFPSLKWLEVNECHGNVYLINIMEWLPSSVFPNLEKLKLRSMNNLKEICRGHLPFGIFSELGEFSLFDLPELLQLWEDPSGHACLEKLKVLDVQNCKKLRNLFSRYTARHLGRLQKQHVGSCQNLEKIFANDGDQAAAAVTSMGEIVFKKLTSLKLMSLPNLTTFCLEMVNSLSSDVPTHPPLFNRKVVFPSLEELTLFWLPKVKEIWHQQLPAENNFRKLRVLKVHHCHRLIIVIPSNLIPSLQNLEELYVGWCDLVEEVFELKGHETVTLPQIRELKLFKIPRLKNMWWNKGPHGLLSLPNLKSLDIYQCNGLRNLFSTSALRGLIQLQRLEIDSCEMMKEIVTTERGEDDSSNMMEEIVSTESGEDEEEKMATATIGFPQLRTLKLISLLELVNIYQGNYILELPSLGDLTIEECPKMKAFPSCDDGFERKWDQKGSPAAIMPPPFFNEKVVFSTLEELTLYDLDNVKEIWNRQLPTKNFCRLRVLHIKNCHDLITIIPSNLQKSLQNLEVLTIEKCYLVEEVFEGLVVDRHEVNLPRIKELKLLELPRLMNMWWNKGPHGFLSLRNLKSLDIYQCNGLRNLFSPSASKGLIQLQQLEIDSCALMKEIVAAESREEDAIETVVFPQRSILELTRLPKLASVYLGNRTIEWPSFEKLTIKDCPKLKTFAAACGYLGTEKFKANGERFEQKMEEGTLGDITQPFFVGKVLLPALKELRIYSLQSLKQIWYNQFPAESFRQLRVLKVKKCDKLLKVGPSNLLWMLQNLEKLCVEECDPMEEVLELGGILDVEHYADVLLSELRELKLHNLPKLVEMWWNIDTKGIIVCPKLSSLKVIKCDRLRNLFLPSKVKGFAHLEELYIANCLIVEEVVAKEEQGEDSGDKVVFLQVHTLVLKNLPNLRSFYSGNLTLEWPSLETVKVEDCPNMHTFSSRLPITPKLNAIIVGGQEQLWEGDLNRTIQNLFKVKY
ncbi:hypothetical protein F0562_025812 [Nyssa sinensis]|uniref:AAA+ ATPase domain-containing protein n=1 Tax=Nyssa sinensis TaxID=561372 RepID=A0A5J5B9K0_9ASTE|nr:hypothetical protein F0562_025812 [Nyssa sinensis]